MVPRFFVEPNALSSHEITLEDRTLVHQIARVFRMKSGDTIIILDNSGMEFEVVLIEVSDRKIHGKILSSKKNENEPEKYITLYQALPKKMALFEWVLEKGTELGVKKIVPLLTRRTERLSIPNPSRLQSILKESAEQSHRGVIPTLENPVSFENALSALHSENILVCDPCGENIRNVLPSFQQKKEIHIFVGPEGGFEKQEIMLAQKKVATVVSLGKRILRTETAPLVICSILIQSS